MYELARIRLFSVGPKGARYQDTTLDLRNAGPPVARPSQEALFDNAKDPDVVPGTLRRPSPATVLFLENGGGKSVLIKLIFSVMLPGRRHIVGVRSSRVLEKFVLAQDVAHVVLEWQHVTTGQRAVIGKVLAWRDHVVSTDPSRLLEAWYSFRPTTGFNLDTLPFVDSGRIVSMVGFRDRLTEAGKSEPHLQIVWETNHGEWTNRLTNLGLDPELFNYQRKMNAGEGEAADAFTFKSDEAFVDWLLTAVANDDDCRSLGDVVDQYAGKLAQRDDLVAERDFVEGALERLTPLVSAARDLLAAEALQNETRRTAETFAGAVTVRHQREVDRLNRVAEQREQVVEEEREADRQAVRLNRTHIEMRRSLAELRWQTAKREMERLERLRDEARNLLAAWRASDTVIAFNKAYIEAERIRRIVAAKEQQAAPVLAEREAAAKRLARGLLAVAANADAEADRLEQVAADLDADTDQAESDQQDAAVQAEQERGRARTAETNINNALAEVKTAVEEGLLGSLDDNVAAVAEQAQHLATEAEERVAAALRELSQLAGQRKRLAKEARAAERDRDTKKGEAEAAARTLRAAEQAAEALRTNDRLSGLLGTSDIVLDTDTPTLLNLLGTAVRTAEQEQTNLRIAVETDQRILDALGTGGLLPPATEVTDALAVLEDKGITAWSGWQYLSTSTTEDRDQVLAVYPHLVDGIVLNNPGHLARAEQILTEARLLPRTVVAVGTTRTLTELTASPPAGLEFMVPPNPAMYDEERAEEERQAIATRRQECAARLTVLAEQIGIDQRLVAGLQDWQRDYPPGTLDRLRDDKATQDELLTEAEEHAAALREQIEQIEQAEYDLQQELPALREAEASTKTCASRLGQLVQTTSQIPLWQQTVREARDAVAMHDTAVEEHRTRASRLRRNARETYRAADDQRRVANGNRDELRKISGAGAVDETMPAPAEPVATLRAAYEAAKTAYEKVEVGIDLRQELSRVEDAEATARADVEGLPPNIRARAEQLLASPDGADAPARAAATNRVARSAQAYEDDHTEQVEVVGQLKNEYRQLPAQEVALELPYERPTTIEQAEALVAQARAEWETARRRYDELRGRRERLDEETTATRTVVDKFEGHLSALTDVTPDTIDPDTPPFAGTADDAGTRRADVMEQFREATKTREETEREVRRATDAVVDYATDERFEKVNSLVRRQIIRVGRENLPQYAEEWETALRPRLRSLTDDLAQINRHRSAIITRLRGMVEQALATLRAAQKRSTLPPGLGDWSGEEFLRQKFEKADSNLLDERLGTVIDEAAAVTGSRTSDKNDGKRDGLTLLLRGVRAAMPKGIKVEMLKPDAVLRTERVRVAEIGDVFSGGQLLTAAIILYCTMAALRANDRGHTRRTHAGVLFLDNPIGRASAGYLLELQMAVAETLGVQLIYTTGLFDTNALSVFPLIVRLRNDADLRAGLKYLTVDDTIHRPLAELGEPDETGRITSTRIYTRPPAPTRDQTA